MKISALNNRMNNNVSFKSNNEDLYRRLKETKKQISEQAKKEVPDLDILNELEATLKKIEKEASSKFKDKKPSAIFKNLLRWFGKASSKGVSTSKIVMWGNSGKEFVGTILYTIQAFTNPDLPPDKRKFIGLYDLFVGIVSTSFSLLFPLVLDTPIKKASNKILKPLQSSMSPATRSKSAIVSAAVGALLLFALQTILAKRIVAPAIATPIAGRIKNKMEADAIAKKNNTAVNPNKTNQNKNNLLIKA